MAAHAHRDRGAGGGLDRQSHGADRRYRHRPGAADRHRRRRVVAHRRQLQAELRPLVRGRRHRLGVARYPTLAFPPCPDRRHRTRYQPRAGAGEALALCRADHRLDSPAAPHPGDDHTGRPAARSSALHGRRRAHRDLPMIGKMTAGIAADTADGMRLTGRILRTFVGELGELIHDTSRWRQCLMAALVVPLAITCALALRLDSVWWAGISAFVTVLATGSVSLKRGLVRIGATTVGVIVAFIVARWLPYN